MDTSARTLQSEQHAVGVLKAVVLLGAGGWVHVGKSQLKEKHHVSQVFSLLPEGRREQGRMEGGDSH